VKLTELTHHNVHVLLDIILITLPVMLVYGNVLLVTLYLIVQLVKIQVIDLLQLVIVLMDGITLMNKLIVTNVKLDVLLVLKMLCVLPVRLTEFNLHQNVHVHQDKLTSMVFVTLVLTDVLNVPVLPLIVTHVLMPTEDQFQLVNV